MSFKLQTEHHLEFLSLKGGCTGSSESTLVKVPHCWKSHVTAHIVADSKDTYQTAVFTLFRQESYLPGPDFATLSYQYIGISMRLSVYGICYVTRNRCH